MIRPNRFMGAAEDFIFDMQPEGKVYNELKRKQVIISMPYESIKAAIIAGFPTNAEGINLTLAQINKLASIYDAIKADEKAENPMAAAWTQWKKLYHIEGDKWVKSNSARSQILTSAIDDTTEWIPVAAIDQKTVLTLASGQVTLQISEGALAGNLDTWKGGYINVNHMDNAEVRQFKIEDAKFEDGLLYHKVSPEAATFIRQVAASGRSIEVQPLEIKDNKVVSYNGLGLSVLFPPYKPACNADMGCSSLPTESQSIISKVFSALAEKAKLNSFMETMIEESGNDSFRDLNLEVSNMEANEIIKLTSALATAESGQEEAKKEIVTLKSSLAEQEATVKDQTDQLKVMTEKLKSYEAAEATAAEKLQGDRWVTLKSSIPKGQVDTPEKEAALKKEFLEDPSGFNLKMVSFMAEKEDPRGESGSSHTQGATSSEVEDFKILELLED